MPPSSPRASPAWPMPASRSKAGCAGTGAGAASTFATRRGTRSSLPRPAFGRPTSVGDVSTSLTRERPDTPDATALIEELEAELAPLYPAESRHGYAVEKLIAQGVAFFVVRHEGRPAGCGGVQIFGADYGELKRMYVRPRFRGLGLAKAMVDRLVDHAREQGVALMRLETGIHQRAAIALYERMGFREIPPFGEYGNDPLSRFYEKRIDPQTSKSSPTRA